MIITRWSLVDKKIETSFCSVFGYVEIGQAEVVRKYD
jgi:hypothetical protein